MHLEVQGDAVPHRKALGNGKDDSRGLSCGSTLNIHQDNFINQGLVDSQFGTTV